MTMSLAQQKLVHKEEVREILIFVTDHIEDLTPLHFDDKRKAQLTEYVSLWRWLISHGYYEKPNEHLNKDKPPIGWLHNLLVSHRSVTDLITLLAAPRVKQSADLKNGSDILMLKMSRILSYSTPQEIPETFYLPPSDPKKTDQEGIPWKKSKSKAAKKWWLRIRQEEKAREALRPKPKPVMTEKEAAEKTKTYLKHKNEQRAVEAKKRQDASDEADRRFEQEKADLAKRSKQRYGG